MAANSVALPVVAANCDSVELGLPAIETLPFVNHAKPKTGMMENQGKDVIRTAGTSARKIQVNVISVPPSWTLTTHFPLCSPHAL